MGLEIGLLLKSLSQAFQNWQDTYEYASLESDGTPSVLFRGKFKSVVANLNWDSVGGT